MNTNNAVGERRQRFDRLVAVYYMDMFRYAAWLCRDRSIAEEVVQEALLRAWKSIQKIVDHSDSLTWRPGTGSTPPLRGSMRGALCCLHASGK